jgi:hypothetical protein
MTRPGDLSITSSSLNFAAKTLYQRWGDMEAAWNDPVSRSFDKEFLEPLEPSVATVLKAINRLSQVMRQACDECS